MIEIFLQKFVINAASYHDGDLICNHCCSLLENYGAILKRVQSFIKTLYQESLMGRT